MEQYSDQMRHDLAQQLRHTDTPALQAMRPYFKKRGGPGLQLLEQELAARAADMVATSTKTAPWADPAPLAIAATAPPAPAGMRFGSDCTARL